MWRDWSQKLTWVIGCPCVISALATVMFGQLSQCWGGAAPPHHTFVVQQSVSVACGWCGVTTCVCPLSLHEFDSCSSLLSIKWALACREARNQPGEVRHGTKDRVSPSENQNTRQPIRGVTWVIGHPCAISAPAAVMSGQLSWCRGEAAPPHHTFAVKWSVSVACTRQK